MPQIALTSLCHCPFVFYAAHHYEICIIHKWHFHSDAAYILMSLNDIENNCWVDHFAGKWKWIILSAESTALFGLLKTGFKTTLIYVVPGLFGKWQSYTSMEFPMKREIRVTSSNGTGGLKIWRGTTKRFFFFPTTIHAKCHLLVLVACNFSPWQWPIENTNSRLNLCETVTCPTSLNQTVSTW